jgi:hypothetical protein
MHWQSMRADARGVAAQDARLRLIRSLSLPIS